MKRPTQKNTSNLERETLGIFWRIVLKNKRLFLGSLPLFIGTVCLYVLVPLFISMALANLVVSRGPIADSLIPLSIAAAVGVLTNMTGFICAIRLNAIGQADALELALETLLRRSVGFHTNNIGGKLVSNALEYPAAWSRLVDTAYVHLLPFIIIMIAGISVTLSRSLILGLALLFITVVTIVLILMESYRRSNLRVQRKEAQNVLIAHFSDTVVNTQAVKTFAGEKRELEQHIALDRHLMQLRLNDWTRTGFSGNARLAVLLGLQIGFIALVASLVQQDPSILGVGIFAFAYTLSLLSRLFDIGGVIRNIEESFLQAASMTKIILEQTEIVDAPDAKALKVAKGAIDIKKIDFFYNDNLGQEKVFEELSLHIPAGQKIGLVGPSGGGKSTLTRLLLRFEDVTTGSITIDGQDVKGVTQASLRQAISYVPQEPLLFHRSIRENIAYGKPKATLNEVKQAAKLAFADGFIEKLPTQYDTVVGERGVKLSGGQRQRVAIARAILKNAPILVLDEATSALDSESEVYIQKALAALMKGRTTIVVAHRLSTIQKMDRIIVLADGKIVEDGNHRELVDKPGLYARLWAHQSGGFIEE